MSMVTLTMAAAMFTQYWGPGFGITSATFVLLIAIVTLNACGVRVSNLCELTQRYAYPAQLYGNLEWIFKWLKIILIILVCSVMVAIKAGGQCLIRTFVA